MKNKTLNNIATPTERTITLTTPGNDHYRAYVEAWSYFGVEDYLPRQITIEFKANDFSDATTLLAAFVEMIKMTFSVWEVKIYSLEYVSP